MGVERIRHLRRGETITLAVGEDEIPDPRIWTAIPGLVSLAATADRRSCKVTAISEGPLGIGRVAVKVQDAGKALSRYFYLKIEEDGPSTIPCPVSAPVAD